MTGISDLSTVFGPSTRTTETSEGAGVESTASSAGAAGNTAVSSNYSLLSSDKTVLSSAGGAMFQAMNTSDVRADKVASPQAAIASGTYNVSSQEIASKLISSMLGKG